ncbi:MAG TPA: adenylate/guanylate cyclase domain-containing protein, partial [Acidimicrobiales bacterium]
RLVDELGIEPGPELRRLETAVLAQDPSLELEHAATAAQLPSGTVTFCFTDIEGSTRLIRRLGDRYAELSERHVALMREAWEAHAGHEVGSVGDSVFVAFQDATAAIHACAAAQRALAAEDWPADGAIRVRMGIHSGLAFPRDGNYVALAVNQAARVMSAAHGGQVLVSGDTVNRLGAVQDVAIVPLGRYRIRDFDEPVRLFELSWAGVDTGTHSVRAIPADGHNLITPSTPLIGRADEVTELAPLLQPGELVTLTGPGGVGKTRLAGEIGRLVASRWQDGVWMVDLAPVHDSSLIGSAVGAAVDAPTRAGDRWADVLDHLHESTALVLLDNCEHLRDACAVAVEQLLATCTRCGVLATSREPLGLSQELVFRVRTLALPPTGVANQDALGFPAVQLFLDRARAARRDVTLDDASLGTIVEICRKLDGLPLALELAAVRLTALQPAELLKGLNDRFRLLQARSPTVPERQRTMEGLLQWSERLLTEPERVCLRRLSIFRTNFSPAAATAAAGFDDIDPADVPALVWSLVDKSLVLADTSANETRYRLLESVREFAAGHLDDDETIVVARRLAAWYLERIGPTARHRRGWTGEVGVEVDNFRALIRLIAPIAPEDAQQIAFTIGRYLDAIQTYRDGIDELTRYVDELRASTPARISLLTSLGDLHLRLGDVTPAAAVLSAAESLRDEINAVPDWDDVAIERTRGEIALRSGDNISAAAAAKRVLSGEISLRGRARMSSQLGIASLALGDLDGAWDAFAEELQAYRQLGDEVFEASSEGNLAEVALRRGDIAAAARHQRASLALALELGMSVMVGFSLIVAARIAASTGSWAVAARLHSHAELILDKTGIVLYADDRGASDEMLTAAGEHLGDSAFAAARSSGRSSDLPAVAAMADRVLADAASVLAESAPE